MRILMKVELCTDKANAAARDGTMGKTIQAILEGQRTESAYFTDSNGKRCGIIVVEMKDASEIPALAEPWFLAFNAHVELHPVMTIKDLAKAKSGIKHAVAKFG